MNLAVERNPPGLKDFQGKLSEHHHLKHFSFYHPGSLSCMPRLRHRAIPTDRMNAEKLIHKVSACHYESFSHLTVRTPTLSSKHI